MINSKIIADSINETGERITTFLLVYPRFIHSEFMTHRAFSRNAASSRAIPIQKMIKAIEDNPAMPMHWGKIQKGMQALVEVDDETKEKAKEVWLKGMRYAIECSNELAELGLHKQIANRVTEPYSHMTTLLTATEYQNFFALRAHADAQPEIRELAYQMLFVYNNSKPEFKTEGTWHLPFGDNIDETVFNDTIKSENINADELRLKIAVARCARTSYTTIDTQLKHNYVGDIKLHDDLVSSGHMSPCEHIAKPLSDGRFCANFKGWMQYRTTLPNENQKDQRVKAK